MSNPQADVQQLGPLLDRSLAGDEGSLNALLAKLRPYLHALVRSRLGPHERGNPGSSDLVQESLMRMHGGFSQFAGRSIPQLLAWVGEIVRNVIASDARYNQATKRDVTRNVPGSKFFESLLSNGSTPSARVARDEEATRLAKAIEQLPEMQRVVIQLRFFDQLRFAEISCRTGKSIGTVRVVCLRAIKQLRTLVEPRP